MTTFMRPRWMNTRFGGSDGNPEKRDGDLVAMVDALAERVAKLEANSHPPIDLTPAIAEILAELGYAASVHAPPTEKLKAAYALYQKRIEPEPAVSAQNAYEDLGDITEQAIDGCGGLWTAIVQHMREHGAVSADRVNAEIRTILDQAYKLGLAHGEGCP